MKFTIPWHINTFIARILCQLNSEPNESHAVATPLILCDNPVQVVQPSAIQGEMPESVCFEVFLPLMADRAPVASRRRCGLGARDHGLPLPWGSLYIRYILCRYCEVLSAIILNTCCRNSTGNSQKT